MHFANVDQIATILKKKMILIDFVSSKLSIPKT